MVEQTLNEQYKLVLLNFMVHMNGQDYDAEYNFSQEKLILINTDAVQDT